MKMVRLVLGFGVGAYGLYNLIPILTTAAFKAGVWRGPTASGHRGIALMQATTWWQLAAWALIAAGMLAAAWRLLRGRHAFGLTSAAFAADAALWWLMQAMPAYQQAYTERELGADYATSIGMVAALIALWLVERPRGEAAAA